MHPDYSFWPWHGFGPFPFFFLIICIVVAFLVGKKSGRHDEPVPPTIDSRDRAAEGPLEILKARYARGEIDQEEFERIKKSISE